MKTDIAVLDYRTSSVYLFKGVEVPEDAQSKDIERVLQEKSFMLDEIHYMASERITICWG